MRKTTSILILALALTACGGQSAGVPTPPLADRGSPAADTPSPPTADPTSTPVESTDGDPPCPSPTPDTAPYINGGAGYCLLYPTGFEVQTTSGSSGLVTIVGPAAESEGSEPLQASLMISVWGDAAGQSPAQVVDAALGEAADEFDLTREEVTIGGETAVLVEGLPGQVETRQAWLVANGMVYHLTLGPLNQPSLQVGEDVDLLWATVTESLSFFPPQVGAEPGGALTMQSFEELGVRVGVPEGWTISPGPGFIGLAPRGAANPNLISIGLLPAMPLELDALREEVMNRYVEQGEGNAQAAESTVGGVQALVVTGVSYLCLDVYLPAHGLVRHISVGANACQPDGTPSDAVLDILGSVEIVEPVR